MRNIPWLLKKEQWQTLQIEKAPSFPDARTTLQLILEAKETVLENME